MKTKFNQIEIGEEFQSKGNMVERCRKANKYWKRFGRRFVCVGEGEAQYIRRIK